MIKIRSKWLVVFLFLLFFALLSIFINRNTQQPLPSTVSPSPIEQTPSIVQDDLSRGWYWGSANQKKPETPDDWVFSEAGRSSCWHEPTTPCQ